MGLVSQVSSQALVRQSQPSRCICSQKPVVKCSSDSCSSFSAGLANGS